jgi:hypothetical protein
MDAGMADAGQAMMPPNKSMHLLAAAFRVRVSAGFLRIGERSDKEGHRRC